MIEKLLQPEIQEFIRANENANPASLMLRASRYPEFPMVQIVEQIQSRKKARQKIPSWYAHERIIYPPTLSLEQCSSEQTALYKEQLVSGKRMADLTGGMGVDTFYIGQQFESVDYVEQQSMLVEQASHNFDELGAKHIAVHCSTTAAFLEENQEKYDLIYLDPARRDITKRKVFRFEHCEPDLVQLLPQILEHSATVLIKASPLLDIKGAVAALGGVTEVHVVAIKNEVKELLFLVHRANISNDPEIKSIDIGESPNQVFDCNFSEEEASVPNFGEVSSFLYEPNAAILKAGAFKSCAVEHDLTKLHPNTHVYTSSKLEEGFPGRIFEIIQPISFNKKKLKKSLPDLKANIIARNFPQSVEEIRKKTGIKEGGDKYILAFRDVKGFNLLLCKRLQ